MDKLNLCSYEKENSMPGVRTGRFDRFPAAGTAWYIPEEGENIFIDSPEDCARVLNEYFL